ncbi:MAG: hypothetical protein ACRDHJ_08495 [Actinomycetota bacterium]
MALILDAGPLIAMADRRYSRRDLLRTLIEEERGPIVLSPYVAAEADHLIGRRFGSQAERLFLRDLASGAYEIEGLTEDEHQLMVEIDQDRPGMGLADLSLIVLAARYRTTRLLTFDERDFRAARPLDGDHFVLLPADLDRG